jgi:hypothetical protein
MLGLQFQFCSLGCNSTNPRDIKSASSAIHALNSDISGRGLDANATDVAATQTSTPFISDSTNFGGLA